ncbi:transposase [Variovorax sp. YR752]|uniref:IS66-like element accessory protein TnpA n=1 Tax=Variovorax sp. YR752 TaxID=1884383 RepID=UPI000BD46590|nr:transposase [Variovorax sp. YR752]SOE06290.1 transposase [Variovorax sp. YR752]
MNDQDTPSKRRRREHSPMFKRELVARSLVPGASVAAVALEAGINSNLLFAWRRMHLSAQEQPQTPAPSEPSPMLLPVTIEAAPVAPCPSPTVAAPRQPAGTIEIDVGGVRVRLRGAVDEASVRHVLQTLKALA